MARIVGGLGVPHTPTFPHLARSDPSGEVATRYGAVASALAEVRPDALVIFSGDHLNTFFLDNWPIFAIHVGEVEGPIDPVPGIDSQQLLTEGGLARAVYRHVVDSGFDPALTLSSSVDHGVAVPLYFLDRYHRLPVVVVHVNGVVGPLPSAIRCWRFGQVVGEAIASYTGPSSRVAVVASGSFSLEVGGPLLLPGHMWGVPAPDWAARVAASLAGRGDDLVALVTPRSLSAAGSVAGETLAWVAMRGATQHLTTRLLDHRKGEGHAFGFWHD